MWKTQNYPTPFSGVGFSATMTVIIKKDHDTHFAHLQR